MAPRDTVFHRRSSACDDVQLLSGTASQPRARPSVVAVRQTGERFEPEQFDVEVKRVAQRLAALVNLDGYVIESDDEAHRAPRIGRSYGRRRS